MNLSAMTIFDGHLHIIDNRFPLIANNGYLPETFTCDDYLTRMRDTNAVANERLHLLRGLEDERVLVGGQRHDGALS